MVAKWHRVCPGLYEIGTVTVDRLWDRDFRCEMWFVYAGSVLREKHAYLRDAKAAAIALTKARGEA